MRIGFVVLALAVGLVAQEPEAQPRERSFGTLCAGSRVEFGFVVWWRKLRPAPVADVALQAPVFAKHLRQKTGTHDTHGPYTEVSFTLDTGTPGPREGRFVLQHAGKRVEFSCQATVLPAAAFRSRLLVLGSPFNGFEGGTKQDWAAWHRLLAEAKIAPSYVLRPRDGSWVTAADLQAADTVLLEGDGLLGLRAGDVRMLQGFVCGGGHLVCVASSFFRGTVPAANRVLAPFEMQMRNVEPPGRIRYEPEDRQLEKHALTRGVTGLKVFRPTPTGLLRGSQARSLVDLFEDDAWLAVLDLPAGGRCASLGVPILWLFASKGAGNARLVRNLLSSGARPR